MSMGIYTLERTDTARAGEVEQAVVVAASEDDARWLVASVAGREKAKAWRYAACDLIGVAKDDDLTDERIIVVRELDAHEDCG